MKKSEVQLRTSLFEAPGEQRSWITPHRALPLLQDALNRSIALGQGTTVAFSGSRSLARYHLRQAETALASQDYSRALLNLIEVRALIRHESWEFHQEIRHQLFEALLQAGHLAAGVEAYSDALRAYDLAFLLAKESIPMIPLQIAQVCLNRGLLYQKLKQIPQALEDFNRAIAVLAPVVQAGPEQIALLAQAFRNRGELQQSLQRTEQALEDFLQAIATQKDLLVPPDPLELAVAFRKLGLLYLHQQQRAEALAQFSRSIEVYHLLIQQGRQEFDQDLISTLMHRSQVLRELHRLSEARQDCDQALALLQRDTLPKRERLLLQARAVTARALLSWQTQAIEEACADYLAALYFYQALRTSGLYFDPDISRLHLNLAHLSLEQSHYDTALEHYDQALAVLAGSPDQLMQAQLLLERGNLHREAARPEAAERDYAAALALYQSLEPHRRLAVVAAMAEVLLQQGLLAADRGAVQQACEQYAAAIELLQPVRPQQPVDADHVWVRSHYFRGFLQATALNQPQAALADFDQVEQVCPGLVSYDRACLLARLGQIPEAFQALENHLSSPYRLDPAEIAADPDLQPLQGLPRWQELLTRALG